MTAKSYDKLQLLRKFSLPRAVNSFQVIISFYISRLFKINWHWGNPMAIAIEPTTACNLGCPECPSGLKQFTRPIGNLKKDFYEKVINQIAKECFYLTFYFQGEPYINKDFLNMVEYANSKRIYTATSTNAHFLDDANAKRTIESGLDRLIISIDGSTQEVYESYRKGGKLDKVIEGTKNIIKWKKKLNSKTPYVIFQFLVVKPNEHQIGDVRKLADDLGVDELKLKTAQIYDYENGNPLIPSIEKYSRYKKQNNGSYAIKNSLENACWKMWHSCVITWDGKVIPCCFDKDANFSQGSLEKQSFQDVWKGNNYKSFRANLLKGRKHIEICKNCSEGTQVWA